MNRFVRLISQSQAFLSLISKICLISTFVIILSCNKNEKDFILGSEFLESQSNIKRVDSFSVELSTVLIDSFRTSNYGTALVGDFSDPLLGYVSCKSYFQLGTPDGYDVLKDDVFDGAKIILVHTGYSYGDTTKPVSLRFSRLSKPIEAVKSTGYLYNTSEVAKADDGYIEIASLINYIHRPHYRDSIEIKVNNNFALDLFSKMKAKNINLSTNERFIKFYLPGLVLEADSGAGCILDFYASSERLILRVISHRTVMNGIDTLYNDFPLVASNLQFNKIKHDFKEASAGVSFLNKQREAVVSSKTGNKSFIYGGVGLMTKIRFPSLSEILQIENSIVLKAELVLKPITEDYKVYTMPSKTMLYNTDKHNNLGTELYNNDGSLYYPTFVRDSLYNENTTYTINLTNFILNELADSYVDTEHGILISTQPSRFINTFERVVFEADPAPILKLYYVTY